MPVPPRRSGPYGRVRAPSGGFSPHFVLVEVKDIQSIIHRATMLGQHGYSKVKKASHANGG